MVSFTRCCCSATLYLFHFCFKGELNPPVSPALPILLLQMGHENAASMLQILQNNLSTVSFHKQSFSNSPLLHHLCLWKKWRLIFLQIKHAETFPSSLTVFKFFLFIFQDKVGDYLLLIYIFKNLTCLDIHYLNLSLLKQSEKTQA